MHKELSDFAARLLPLMREGAVPEAGFNSLALELFALQFKYNAAYQKTCLGRDKKPDNLDHWTQIPAAPTAAFKELDLTSLAPIERTTVFHSSGTTGQLPSRHYHSAESLQLYEELLWPWFEQNVGSNLRFTIYDLRLVCLTPPPSQAPYSSLVHMFETIRRKLNAPESVFVGKTDATGAWTLDFDATLAALDSGLRTPDPGLILGTAFSFVHLLDFLAENNLKLKLPAGSLVMETGGYKNRSRSMPKPELHALIADRLGVPRENILCEYGMSELSSQAYEVQGSRFKAQSSAFRFPSWARAQVVSPETGREVAEGETGLVRIFDLANVFSVAAVQTEDLAVRRGDGFGLIGRAAQAENRGCSLMTV